MEDISRENLLINDLSLIEKARLEASLTSTSFYKSSEHSLLDQNLVDIDQPSSQSTIFIEPTTSDTQGVPSDPGVIPGNFWEQWQYTGGNGLNVMAAWEEYTGEGVRVGILDDGFNYDHSELSPNFNTGLDYDVLDDDNNSINDAGDNHGTYVAQMIAGDDNGARTVGAAFDSEIVGIRRGFGSEGTTQDTLEAFEYALANGFDVMNNSWGIDSAFGDNTKIDFIGTDTSDVTAAMQNLVEQGRGGLGTSIVFSAGNSRASGMSSNYKNYQNSPYSITVGALKEDGTFADFSEAGANLLVTAAGDSLYVANPTDTNSANIISGTSFSAPLVSGVIALMLEANPDLGYRDVQEILAMSSRQTDAGGTGWAGEGWQTNGATNWNGGGMHFSYDYGYGNVDALAAVRMAETWTLQQTYANMITIPPVSSAPALAIPSLGTITTTIDIAQDISIEHVLINLDISHGRAGDLVVTLTSPNGTDSVLMYNVENGAYTSRYGITGVDFEFSSVALWGESSAGEWTLTITDEVSGNAGTLNDWSLEFLGSAQSNDDLYVYTNEYASATGANNTLIDNDGGVDTINAAAVTSDTTIDLGFGGTLAGNIFIIDPGTTIENLITGDGNDVLTGNYTANEIYAGRGDDTIISSLGDDIIDGAQGEDSIVYNFNIADFLIDIVDSVTVALTQVAQSFMDTLSNIENFIFADGAYTRAQLDNYVAGGGGQGVFVDSKLTMGWSGGGFNLNNRDAGTFNYTGESLAQTGVTQDILTVVRADTTLSATVLQNNAIDTVTLRNDGLTVVTLDGFRSLWLDQDQATADLDIDVSNAMRGRIDAGSGNDIIDVALTNVVSVDPTDVDEWTISSGAGNDTVIVSGNITNMVSTVYLGAGVDSFTSTAQGNDRVYGEDGNDTIRLGAGNDYAEGGNDNDTLYGESGDDILKGGAGIDMLYGGAGLDRLEGGLGGDTLDGGDGNDSLFGEGGDDTLTGGVGADTLRGGDDNDTLSGGAGRDKVFGDAGNDTVNGDAGRDFLRGGDGIDTLYGGVDSDKLYGDNGADTLYGESGFDALYGGTGNDGLYGGADNDRLYGQADNDTLDGGVGDDILDGGIGNDTLTSGDGNDRAYGGSGDDVITGGLGNDRLYGNAGNDRLEGGDGTDYLYAGAGIDVLIGGAGADRMYGDTGADTFGLTDIGTGVDRLYNFTSGEDILNITDLLTGYTHGVDDINDFVQVLDLGNGSTDVRINADGDSGGIYGRVALIYNDFGGSTVDDLVTDGTLVANQVL
ncbi:MAG: hypothetical protein CMH31_03545 [Micavibrio sp.]|nr:hypothetical protein [Micavibrio sp.]